MKKILNIVVCALLITSSIVLSYVNVDLVKSDATPQIADVLPLNYVWLKTNSFSNVIYNAYFPDDIGRGRSFASNGGTYTKNLIFNELNVNISLDDVHTEQLKHIDNLEHLLDDYSSIINVTDFSLTVNTDDPYPFSSKTLDKNEMYSIPSMNGHKSNSDYWTEDFTIENDAIVPTDFTTLFPLAGSYTDYYYTVTNYEFLSNDQSWFVGIAAYISPEESIPTLENQTGKVFLLDDVESSQSKLDNLTEAVAAIIIESEGKGIQNITADQATISVVNVSYTTGQTVKELIENNITMIDNIGNEGQTLTFTYDLLNGFWPADSAFVLFDQIPNHNDLWDNNNDFLQWVTQAKIFGLEFDEPNIASYMVCVDIKATAWIILNLLHEDAPCNGTVLSDHGDYHFMLSIPKLTHIFTVNESVGNFLLDENHYQTATFSGYSNQRYLDETISNPGGIGYNVMGNLSIEKSPNDEVAIISSRYDGMWGQTPGDSGVGSAIILGMAKYFKDEIIIPKYNLTFLFTTGEEYNMLGMKYFNDLHDDYNVKYWFILDQLAFNQQDTALCLHANSSIDMNKALVNKAIIQAIVNDTHYYDRTEYDNITTADCAKGSEQGVANRYGNRETFCLVKDQDYRWDNWHRTGADFTKGDCLDNTDRNDVNITIELFWRILEYYLVNPNCWFSNTNYQIIGSSGGTIPDSIKATFTVKSSLPSDRVLVNVSLYDASTGLPVPERYNNLNLETDRTGVECNVTFSMPSMVNEGDYYIKLEVYNSTARINMTLDYDFHSNDTEISSTFHLNKYRTLGDIRIGTTSTNCYNYIRGSKYTPIEDLLVHNITAYVYGTSFGDSPIYQCMIYRWSDGHLIGSTDQIQKDSTGWLEFSFNHRPILRNNTQYVLSIWGDNNAYVYSTYCYPVGNGYTNDTLTFGTPPEDITWGMSLMLYQHSVFCNYGLDLYLPEITNVSAAPDTVGFGYNVTISANISDNGSGLKEVKIRIGEPGGREGNYTMTHVSNNLYQYVHSDSWLVGQYNYSIWTQDNETNSNTSDTYHFHVSANATISIATLQNSYTGNQYINITDPPNPPENLTLVGRGLSWNTYYNVSSGENILETYQGPVNYQMENGTWTPINNTISPLSEDHPAYVYGYRKGNDQGLYGVYFKSNAQQEWPVAFTYNKSDDPTIHAIRSKLVGVGYVDPQSNWAYQYLQNVQSSQGQTNDYSITYPGVFTGTDVTWSYGNTGLKEEITLSNATKTVLQSHPPSQYGLNDSSSYLVFITKLDYQGINLYNNSGLLDGNVTISDTGVEFKDLLGQFKCALPLGEAYELNNESVRETLTYRIVHLNGNTYLLSGLKISKLTTMIFPVIVDPTLTVYSLTNDGYIYNSSSNYNTAWTASTGTICSSTIYLSIGQSKVASFPPDYRVYRGFLPFNTSSLPSNAFIDRAVISLYKKDDYSTTDFTITIQNGQPTYPHSPLQIGDYAKSHYSGNGGGLNTANFVNGRNNITLTDLTWINKTGITKLCLRSSRDMSGTTPSGSEYVNVYSANAMDPMPDVSYKPKLIITYRNQSKIKNTGATDINGYLLIQIQFYNTSQAKWLLDNDTINETTARTINSGKQLALDTIFNGHVRASDLTHGTGTYRVYAAFRDPEGNILRTNDDVDLEAWWQFSKN